MEWKPFWKLKQNMIIFKLSWLTVSITLLSFFSSWALPQRKIWKTLGFYSKIKNTGQDETENSMI